MSAWRKVDSITSTIDVSRRPSGKSLHRPLWNDMSCLLDALVACICAMAFHPSRLYYSRAVLGSPVSRQIAFDMESLAQQYKSWLEVPAPLLTEQRDAWRNLLQDYPRFVDAPIDLAKTGLDVLDKVVLTQDPFEYAIVGRSVCKDCGSNETTFVKAMGGLYLSIQPDSNQYAFKTVQNIVNFVVRRPAFHPLIWDRSIISMVLTGPSRVHATSVASLLLAPNAPSKLSQGFCNYDLNGGNHLRSQNWGNVTSRDMFGWKTLSGTNSSLPSFMIPKGPAIGPRLFSTAELYIPIRCPLGCHLSKA